MRLYIANTDYDWYSFLQRQPDLDEANFWRPSGKQVVGYLRFGDPFVFKLKSEHRHAIVGFGFFVAFARLSVQEAWETFGEKNGAASLDVMWRRVSRYAYRSTHQPYNARHPVGCDLIASPIFFPRDMWIEGPADWSKNIVTGSGNYDASHGEGRRIWEACMERAAALGPAVPLAAEPGQVLLSTGEVARYGRERMVRPRLGQGTFRFAVQSVYGKCAVTREHSLPALDAAHIVPYGSGGRHEIPNGLLLRADIHKLFDRGYVTVTPDFRFRVSPRLQHEYHNGKIYYQLEGTELWLPDSAEDRPRREHLERHNDEVFLAA
jgi:putative restriction endonuclease